jgi:hypothetical protein
MDGLIVRYRMRKRPVSSPTPALQGEANLLSGGHQSYVFLGGLAIHARTLYHRKGNYYLECLATLVVMGLCEYCF